jgi:hypothetical protein
VIVRMLCVEPISGKEDLARCMQISCPMWSWFCGSVHVRRLTKYNKEEDVAPHSSEPHISCVVVALCIIVVMLLM